jgi:hypothetical protein
MRLFLLALFCSSLAAAASAADLTAREIRWLKAAAPVLAYSQTQHLPVDITVQPEARPSDVALAMGFVGGRCKLVVSLRGNAEAEQVLAGVPADQQDLLIETMAAHELGHCWRYVQHTWHALPTGFVAADDTLRGDGAAQREEAYADLVALAWVRSRHPGQYQQIYRWIRQLRDIRPLSGGSHDTRAWLQLAADPARLGVVTQPFADVETLWRIGLSPGK